MPFLSDGSHRGYVELFGNRIARGTRVSTYRRVFPGSNQAGIHRVCCQPGGVPHAAVDKCIIEPRVRVTRRAMTRESTPRKSGNPWSCLSALMSVDSEPRKILSAIARVTADRK